MARQRRRISWFETLRRDRALFAMLGCIVLLAATLKPLAEANASDSVKAWLICTSFGVVRTETPLDVTPPAGLPDDCPLCLAGHTCGAAPTFAKAFLRPSPLLLPPAALPQAAGIPATTYPPARPGEPPPSIRAPPLSA